MAEYVEITPGTGAKVGVSHVNDGGTVVERQHAVIADPTIVAGKAQVTNQPPANSAYGLVVRLAGSGPSEKVLGGKTTLNTGVATKIPATPMTGRTKIRLRNRHDSETCYLGDVNVTDVGATQGYPLGPGETEEFELGAGVDLYGYNATLALDINHLEMGEA